MLPFEIGCNLCSRWHQIQTGDNVVFDKNSSDTLINTSCFTSQAERPYAITELFLSDCVGNF